MILSESAVHGSGAGAGRTAILPVQRLDVSSPTSGVDTIRGFTGQDTQEVAAAGFVGLGLGPLDPERFVANAAGVAVGAGAKIVHDTDEGVLGYDPDGAGGAALFGVAVLACAPNLTAADLVVVA